MKPFRLAAIAALLVAQIAHAQIAHAQSATLIGGPTGGGAHPGDMHRIGDHFEAFIPDSRSISPITHTDWEGTGVAPDVTVDAARALVEARKQLLKSFAAGEKNPRAKAHLQEEIEKL